MIELTLSPEFRELEGSGVVDPRDFRGYVDLVKPTSLSIDPLSFMLGRSVETVDVPVGLVGVVFAKSTLLRCGLAFGCGFLQPGWSGRLVLELGNLNRHRALRLWVDDPIAHVAFFPSDAPAYSGRYAFDNPMAPLVARPPRCSCGPLGVASSDNKFKCVKCGGALL